MTQSSNPSTIRPISTSRASPTAPRPAYQAYLILHVGFVVLPIVMGVDKFFDFLGSWDMYLAPLVPRLTHLDGHTFMMVVGVIEIVAGLLVAFRPRIGACVIVLWLCGIIVNLLLIPGFYDIAMRDFGLLLGALALQRLSREFGRHSVL
jgi:uncharacterized membrane protein YphA (DoxX/SURF4 family)